ncbi:unnamed protein product, partial [Iphiclides podalirius]
MNNCLRLSNNGTVSPPRWALSSPTTIDYYLDLTAQVTGGGFFAGAQFKLGTCSRYENNDVNRISVCQSPEVAAPAGEIKEW